MYVYVKEKLHREVNNLSGVFPLVLFLFCPLFQHFCWVNLGQRWYFILFVLFAGELNPDYYVSVVMTAICFVLKSHLCSASLHIHI